MRRTPHSVGWVLLTLLVGSIASAWPVDFVLDVPVAQDKFVKLASAKWVQSADPSIAEAEILPTGELMVTGKAPGRTVAVVDNGGKLVAWRLRVSAPGKSAGSPSHPELLAAAKKACPGLKTAHEGESESLTASVASEPCRMALRALFQQVDDYLAENVTLTFDIAELQAQLKELSAALEAKKIPLLTRYLGAGLILEGELSDEDRHRALAIVFEKVVGRIPFEDRIQPPDAGTPAKDDAP